MRCGCKLHVKLLTVSTNMQPWIGLALGFWGISFQRKSNGQGSAKGKANIRQEAASEWELPERQYVGAYIVMHHFSHLGSKKGEGQR